MCALVSVLARKKERGILLAAVICWMGGGLEMCDVRSRVPPSLLLLLLFFVCVSASVRCSIVFLACIIAYTHNLSFCLMSLSKKKKRKMGQEGKEATQYIYM